MRKFFVYILLLLFVTTNLGVSLSMHFCHGNLAKVKVSEKIQHCGGEQLAPSCCHGCDDMLINLDNQTEKISEKETIQKIAFTSKQERIQGPEILGSKLSLKEQAYIFNDSSPPKLYKLYCSYCFYG